MNWLLTITTFFPLVGVLAIMLMKPPDRGTYRLVKITAIVTSLITFLLTLLVWWQYNANDPALQLVDRFNWIPSWGISYFMGVDGLSILMVLLTSFISLLAIAASWKPITTQIKLYYAFMLLLEMGMLGVFLAQDLFLFYIFWEFTLVPMYFLIGIWGGQNRVYASIKFFLYTMAGSLLMLLAILYLGINNHTFGMPELIAGRDQFAGLQNWLFIAFFVAFAIKVPVFPFHSWLPDAHTEAPTAGSIILAGVLLKMGTYGFTRFNLPLFPQASWDFAPFIAVLAIIGIIYGAIVSFAQKDAKRLVAYTSISHLGFVTLGIFSLNSAGIQGGILQGVNHGISTGALFFLVGYIYEQRHTRLLSQFGGLWRVVPLFTALSLIVVLSSMGLPGLNGFVGEFTILLGSMGSAALGSRAWIYTAFATTGVILAAVYMLWFFQCIFMGPLDNPENEKLVEIQGGALVVMLAFIVVIFWIGLAPSGWFHQIDATVNALVSSVQGAVVALVP